MGPDELVKVALSEVPKAVAAGVVDMGSGMLLAIKTAESHPQEVIDILAPATRELFEGEMVQTIENLFKKSRGVATDERYFQEMMIGSTNLWHYFGRIKSSPETVLCVVAGADVNMGMFLVKARQLAAKAQI